MIARRRLDRTAATTEPTSTVASKSPTMAVRAATAGLRRAHFHARERGSNRSSGDRLARQPSIEVVGQGLGAGIAAGRFLDQALQDDRLQVTVHSRADRQRPGRL